MGLGRCVWVRVRWWYTVNGFQGDSRVGAESLPFIHLGTRDGSKIRKPTQNQSIEKVYPEPDLRPVVISPVQGYVKSTGSLRGLQRWPTPRTPLLKRT